MSIEELSLLGPVISILPDSTKVHFAHLVRLECSPSALISISSGAITIPSLVSLYLHIPSPFKAEFTIELWDLVAQNLLKAVPKLDHFVLSGTGDDVEIVSAMVMVLLNSFANLQILEIRKCNLSHFSQLLPLHTLPNPPKKLFLRDCLAEDGALLKLLKSSESEKPLSIFRFSQVLIDSCKGFTQTECEELRSLVDSLKVVC